MPHKKPVVDLTTGYSLRAGRERKNGKVTHNATGKFKEFVVVVFACSGREGKSSDRNQRPHFNILPEDPGTGEMQPLIPAGNPKYDVIANVSYG